MEYTSSLYSSVVERWSCKPAVLGSIPSGGFLVFLHLSICKIIWLICVCITFQFNGVFANSVTGRPQEVELIDTWSCSELVLGHQKQFISNKFWWKVPYSKKLKANPLNHGFNSAFDLVVVHTGYQMAISSHVDATPESHVITGIPVYTFWNFGHIWAAHSFIYQEDKLLLEEWLGHQ